MFYVYIIYSDRFDRYYVGSSEDPWKRISSHNTKGFNTYTSKYRPWKLSAVFEAGQSRGEAEKLEKLIKRQKSRRLVERMIDPGFVPDGFFAQLVRVPHVRD